MFSLKYFKEKLNFVKQGKYYICIQLWPPN